MTFELAHVDLSYRETPRGSPREVFRDLTLAIRGGECVVVLGREGSGKSTLLFLLDGLIAPTRGSVLIGGRDPHRDPRHGRDARRRIAFSFQFPDEQFLQPTVSGEFRDFLTGRGVPAPEVEDRMMSSLSFAGLDPVRTPGRSPFTLSTGESRRLALALAHASRPDAALLDEPTAGMDALAGSCIVNFLRDMRERRATVVIASHDVDLAAEVADRVVILDGGGIAAEGEAKAVLTRGPVLERYGYDVPDALASAGRVSRE